MQVQQKFDVFLNFRGEDVRYSFLSHLLGALNQASLQIFVDYKIKRGDEISLALMSAIENSKLAITIFSKNYATSRWCLDELVKIKECTENPRIKQIVIPVYYHVTSIEVKSQSGSFAEAFTDHEKSKYLENRRKVPIWKAAMKTAGGFSGRSVKEKSPEYDVVVEIVNDVLKALGRPPMENKADGSYSSVRLIHTVELQVKGNIWTPIDLDSFLKMFKPHAYPSSSPLLEWNPQTYSSNSQASKHGQSEGSKDTDTSSGPPTEWKGGQSEGSKATDTSSGPPTEWKGGQSEGSKSTEISSASVHNTSYLTTDDARDKVVLFVTSSCVSVAPCEAVRQVLRSYGVSFDERDTSMSSHWKELEDVLNGKTVQFPVLLVKGYFIGGYEEIMKFKESGKLTQILSARNRTLSLDHNRKKETETRPSSNAKVVHNTNLGMAKPEGSKSTEISSASVQNTSCPTTDDARDKVVLFVTSSCVAAARCKGVREVLKGYGVSFDERNTSIASYWKELEDVLNGKTVQYPALCVKGDFIGGYEEIMKLKHSGKLAEILQDFLGS